MMTISLLVVKHHYSFNTEQLLECKNHKTLIPTHINLIQEVLRFLDLNEVLRFLDLNDVKIKNRTRVDHR